MSELQTVSLVLLKISISDLSLGVRNRSDTVTSKICSLQPSQNMGAQRVVYQSGTPGFIPIKNLLAHSPDFLIFSCLQQANFILQVEGRVVSLFVVE